MLLRLAKRLKKNVFEVLMLLEMCLILYTCVWITQQLDTILIDKIAPSRVTTPQSGFTYIIKSTIQWGGHERVANKNGFIILLTRAIIESLPGFAAMASEVFERMMSSFKEHLGFSRDHKTDNLRDEFRVVSSCIETIERVSLSLSPDATR